MSCRSKVLLSGVSFQAARRFSCAGNAFGVIPRVGSDAPE
jgi:hypothetical protein